MNSVEARQQRHEGLQDCQLTGNGCGKARQSTTIERSSDDLSYSVDSRASLSQRLTGFAGDVR